MGRIKPATFDTGQGPSHQFPSEFGAVLAHRPEFAKALVLVEEALHVHNQLPARLCELIRLRIAFHNQCRTCMSQRHEKAQLDGVTEELICSLERPEESSDLTDAERAALRFADLFANDHLAIDDAVFDDLRRYFDEGEILEIGLTCAMDVGIGRLVATLNFTKDLPEYFLEDRPKYAPWEVGNPEVLTWATAPAS